MLYSKASIQNQPTNKTNKPKQQQKHQSKNVFLNAYSRLKILSLFCFKNRSCGGLIAKVCIFYSTTFEQYKIPGLFLRSKFVPTHQCKRISKSFASAKKTKQNKKKTQPTLIIFMALGLLLILMLQ